MGTRVYERAQPGRRLPSLAKNETCIGPRSEGLRKRCTPAARRAVLEATNRTRRDAECEERILPPAGSPTSQRPISAALPMALLQPPPYTPFLPPLSLTIPSPL